MFDPLAQTPTYPARMHPTSDGDRATMRGASMTTVVAVFRGPGNRTPLYDVSRWAWGLSPTETEGKPLPRQPVDDQHGDKQRDC